MNKKTADIVTIAVSVTVAVVTYFLLVGQPATTYEESKRLTVAPQYLSPAQAQMLALLILVGIIVLVVAPPTDHE